MQNILFQYQHVLRRRNKMVMWANSALGTGDTLFKPPVRGVTNATGFYVKYSGLNFLITNLSDPNLLANTSGVNTKITLDGYFGPLSFGTSAGRTEDKVKLTKIEQWGTNLFDGANQFNGCTNLIVDSNDILYLKGSVSGSFVNVLNFKSIDKVNYLQTTNLNNLYNGAKINNPDINHIQIYAPLATSASYMFENVVFTGATKITIDAPLISNISYLLRSSNFGGKLILKTPSLTNILAAFAFNSATIDLSECDFSKVNSNNNFITNPLNLIPCDLLLMGWKHNADRLVNGTPKGMISGVIWNMRGSHCSSSGWNAKLSMEAAYGITFTNLVYESSATPTPDPWEVKPGSTSTFSETFSETF